MYSRGSAPAYLVSVGGLVKTLRAYVPSPEGGRERPCVTFLVVRRARRWIVQQPENVSLDEISP